MWKHPNASVQITFYPDHTLSFAVYGLTTKGSWSLADDEFTVTLRQASRPDSETITRYSHPRLCHGSLILGPSRQIGLEHGQQIGESTMRPGGVVYKRAR